MNPLEQLSLPDLRRRTSEKWAAYESDVLPLFVAEMDVALAGPVREAVEQALREGDTGYPSTAAGHAYAEALGAFAEERFGWDGLDPARTAVVGDVMTGAMEALRLVTAAGDSVVVNPPVYPPFFGVLESIGRTIVEVPLRDARLDLAALEECFTETTPAAYFLCSPHNPTGTVHTYAELREVARLAQEHGVRVVVDEIHAPLVLPGATFTPYLSVDDRGLSVSSASKAWNLAGLKAAVLAAGPDSAGDLQRLPWVVSHGPSGLGVLAHTAALRHGGEWLDGLLAGLDDNRALLVDLVAEHLPGAGIVPPQGTYLAWLDCRVLGEDPAGIFLERARVGLNDGRTFGTAGAGHVRLNYATSRTILTEAVARMGATWRACA